MGLHEVGYRSWNQKRTSRLTRPLAIARSGVSLVMRSKWLRLLLMSGWLPIVFPGLIIFIFEYGQQSNPEQIVGMLSSPMVDRPDLAVQFATDPSGVRRQLWASSILTFFRYPQLFAMVLLIGVITPRLVSYDLRSRAYLQYFARPLSPLEYMLGKSAVIWFFLAMIVTLPALGLYVLAVMVSPTLDVVLSTWDLPLRILACSVVLLVPTTTLAMVYSSMTTESRYATFAWYATWAMGFVAYTFLTFAPGINGRQTRPRFGRGRRQSLDSFIDPAELDQWRLVSPYHTLGKVQSWIFGLDETPGSVWPAMVVLVAIVVVGTWIVRRRIQARLSV